MYLTSPKQCVFFIIGLLVKKKKKKKWVENLNGDGPCDGGIDDGGGMSHDAAALDVAEAVDDRPDGPLHQRRRGERQETEGGAHHLAPTRVARRPALHAHRNSNRHI